MFRENILSHTFQTITTKNASVYITSSNLFTPTRVDEIVIQNISVRYLLFLKFIREYTITAILLQLLGVSQHPNNSEGLPSLPPQCSAIPRINLLVPHSYTFDSMANLHNTREKYHAANLMRSVYGPFMGYRQRSK